MSLSQRIQTICVLSGFYLSSGNILADKLEISKGRFTQLTLTFGKPFQFSSAYDAKLNKVMLLVDEIDNFDTLKALDTYDERLIRRVQIDRLEKNKAQISLTLADDNLKHFEEIYESPSRLIIYIYDRGFTLQDRDPKSGALLANLGDPKDKKSEKSDSEANEGKANRTNSSGNRHLLQPLIGVQEELDAVSQASQKISGGALEGWSEFPMYLAPFPIELLIGIPTYQAREVQKTNEIDQHSTNEICKNLFKLAFENLRLGDQKRSLYIFQQVLLKSPSLFEEDPLALFAISELYLGQKNLTLAKGYFEKFISLHPLHPLTNMAKLRLADVKFLQKEPNSLLDAEKMLNGIVANSSGEDHEFISQKIIRNTFWKQWISEENKSVSLPILTKENYEQLKVSCGRTLSLFTKFQCQGLSLKYALNDQEFFNTAIENELSDYLKKFGTEKKYPYVEELSKDYKKIITDVIPKLVKEKNYDEVVSLYKNAPGSLKGFIQDPEIAWMLAVSFQESGVLEQAGYFFNLSYENQNDPYKKIESLMRKVLVLSDVEYKANKKTPQYLNKSDKLLWTQWSVLNQEARDKFLNKYQSELNNLLDNQIVSPAKILLDARLSFLSTFASTKSDSTEINKEKGSIGETVLFLKKISEKFKKINDLERTKKCREALMRLTPKDFSGDKVALSIWSGTILELAEESRKENQYRIAGELYLRAAREMPDWERRSECLYKGGLLMHQGGKRDEAVKAFNEAVLDGSNPYYSNLAKLRIGNLK